MQYQGKKRSKFSLSNQKLFSGSMGELIPCGLMEVLPGDSIRHKTSVLSRAQPQLAPVMHKTDVRIHHFFVPHRLVWTEFEDFITGGPDGMNASVFPTITIGGGSGAAVGSLADYLGVPTGVNNIVVSALPFRGYALIWNEFFRDQDLQAKLVLSKASGADITTNMTLQKICWAKDYFTMARPWEAKGPAITIPLAGQAPVEGIGVGGTITTTATTVAGRQTGSLADMPIGTKVVDGNVFDNVAPGVQLRLDASAGATAKPEVYANLTGVSAVTISQLRTAFAAQRMQEARAQFGSRYVDYLGYLGVNALDARLDRPELLAYGNAPFQWSEVLTTAANGADPVGTMKGHGIATTRSNKYERYFQEHGFVFTFYSVRPKSIYVNGLHRHWNRRVKEDFWQFELQHIGQQAIKKKEVYAASASPEATFGYADRYAEYREHPSTIAGEFRTTDLNFWHMARDFAADPALNATFVECVPPERQFPVPSKHTLWSYAMHSIQARRLVASTSQAFIF